MDILFCGSGYFTEVMLCDLAALAPGRMRIGIGGRDPARLKWLVDAASARAALYGTGASFESVLLDYSSEEALAQVFAEHQPKVIVQSASLQSPWSVDNGSSAWSDLVEEAGFGMTVAFHALLAWRSSGAIAKAGIDTRFVNTCYPEGVGQILAAAGRPICTGVGNIGMFASMVGGRLPPEQRSGLRVLAHHRHIVEWRKKPGTREGAPIRAWIDDDELPDADALTADIRLPYRDLNIVTGASAVPVLLGLAGCGPRRCHVPCPNGLPGGYPVIAGSGGVTLDLPKGLGVEEAIVWNRQFEEADGVSIADGRVTYSEHTRQALSRHSKELSRGFGVNEVEDAAAALGALRASMGG